MPDGRVEFEITADRSKADASIDEVTARLQKSGSEWEKTAKGSTDNIGNSFEGMLKKISIAAAASAVGKALVDFGSQAIEAASDLREVQNVVDTTFGEQGAAQIETWAKKAGTQFGLTETQAKKFTSTLGAMMKSSGLAGDEIVKMSTDMSGLVADMASFYNLDFDTAFQKIRSGISGETEPLKQLGINMSVANLEAFALQQGLEKTFSEMTQGEQVMLRYQYLMQATSDAQGDFEKTSDGFANATRRIETAVESLKAKVGTMLLDTIEPLTAGLAGFLEKLTAEPEYTVLDEFKTIDANTEKKLAEISQTADDARDLIAVLKEIEQSSQNTKNNLDGTKIEITEGTATNAKSLAESLKTINSEKSVKDVDIADTSTLGKSLKEGAKNAGSIKSNLEELPSAGSLSLEGTKLYSSVKDLDKFANSAQSGITQFQENLQKISEEGVPEGFDDVSKAVEDTASASDKASTASGEWLETCKRLVQTIPGLSTIINTQTGEITGGTAAVEDYIDTWERAQKNLALIDANRQKHTALESRSAELPGLEIDMKVAEKKLRDQKKTIETLAKRYGIDIDWYNGDLAKSKYTGQQNVMTQDQKDWNYAVDLLISYQQEVENTTKAYNEQKAAYDEAKEALEEADQALIENMTAEEKAALIVDKYTEAQQAAQQAVEEASAAVQDYRKNAIDKASSSVDSLISKFKKIEAPSVDDLPKPDEMTDALQSQLEFMQKYRENLAAAKEAGLDENLLAELADGSEESAKYLQSIADNPSEIEKINEAYRAVNEEKKAFSESLADTTLAVDDAYQELLEKEQNARDQQKEVEDAIAANAGDCIAQMAANINNNADKLEQAVNNVNSILSKLGLSSFTLGSIGLDGSHATGLNYVPFNGYLAELHEGEGILTAEENRLWQNFKSGQRGVDYDQLGGVMRDNVQAGGNVYLDGKVVGSVISDIQGSQYRTLKRSGWQA